MIKHCICALVLQWPQLFRRLQLAFCPLQQVYHRRNQSQPPRYYECAANPIDWWGDVPPLHSNVEWCRRRDLKRGKLKRSAPKVAHRSRHQFVAAKLSGEEKSGRDINQAGSARQLRARSVEGVQREGVDMLRSSASACGGPITSSLYADAETAQVPSEALAASLGCGNPTALAELKAR